MSDAPLMRLYWSSRSPFVRKVMVLDKAGRLLRDLFFPLTETTGNIWLLAPTKE